MSPSEKFITAREMSGTNAEPLGKTYTTQIHKCLSIVLLGTKKLERAVLYVSQIDHVTYDRVNYNWGASKLHLKPE